MLDFFVGVGVDGWMDILRGYLGCWLGSLRMDGMGSRLLLRVVWYTVQNAYL